MERGYIGSCRAGDGRLTAAHELPPKHHHRLRLSRLPTTSISSTALQREMSQLITHMTSKRPQAHGEQSVQRAQPEARVELHFIRVQFFELLSSDLDVEKQGWMDLPVPGALACTCP